MILRPYQKSLIGKLQASTARRKVTQCPTGSGKSVIIQEQIKAAPRLAVMAHAEWLIDQLSERMPSTHQVIKAGVKYDGSKHIVGMIQTIVNRLDSIPCPDLVIVDEGHHAVSQTYRKILDRWTGAEVQLYTATPQRLDGQGLDAVADDLICGPQYQELIDDKWLKTFEVYSVPSDLDLSQCRTLAGEFHRSDVKQAVRRSTIFGDVVDHWQRLGRDGGHASFWTSIKEAEHAASLVPGWHALHSKLPKDRIKSLIDGLRTGSVESLASVGMIGEGLDVLGLSSVSLCRPTKSLTFYMQACGRCNRGGTGVARIMDHVQNWTRHGLPDDDRAWSLKGRVKSKQQEAGSFLVWDCPECWSVNRSCFNICQACGTDKPREIRIIEQREAHLELITRADRKDIHDLCSTPDEYREFAKVHGKRQCWAAYQLALRGLLGQTPDNPFSAADDNPRPTKDQFMRAAWEIGLDPKYAVVASKKMWLRQ